MRLRPLTNTDLKLKRNTFAVSSTAPIINFASIELLLPLELVVHNLHVTEGLDDLLNLGKTYQLFAHSIFVGWQVLDARKQREAGQPHWSLAPAGGRGTARGGCLPRCSSLELPC